MAKVLVVVAHRAGARFYEVTGPNKEFIQLEEVDFEEGRMKSSELRTDKPGRSFESGMAGSTGSVRHAIEKKIDEHESVAIRFAKTIADTLDKKRTTNEYSKFVVCADPHFLGLLKSSVSKQTEKHVGKFVNKDYSNAGRKTIEDGLHEVVAEVFHNETFSS